MPARMPPRMAEVCDRRHMATDAQRWIRRAGDAATEAILAGVTPDEILAAVEAGIREGGRVRALRNPAPVATTPTPPQRFVPDCGSAIEQLMRVAGAA